MGTPAPAPIDRPATRRHGVAALARPALARPARVGPALAVAALAGLALALGAPAASAHAPSDGLPSLLPMDPEPAVEIDGVVAHEGVFYVRFVDTGFTYVFDPATESLRTQSPASSIEAELIPVKASCLPADPDVCVRAVPNRLAIEETTDRGATWTMAWELSDPDRARLARSHSVYFPMYPEYLYISSVAIAPTGDGYVVLASAQYDGLVMRHEDGTWERIGFADGNVVKLGKDPTLAMPYPVVWALGAFCLLLAFFTEAGGPRGGRPRRVRGERTFLILGILLAAGVILGNRVGAERPELGPDAAFGVALLALFAVAATLRGAALRERRPGSQSPLALGLAALGSVAVAVAMALVPTPAPGESWAVTIVVGAVAVVASAVLGVRRMRRAEPAATASSSVGDQGADGQP